MFDKMEREGVSEMPEYLKKLIDHLWYSVLLTG